jgi:O-antigen/teichoic acid export membrane protein
MLRNAIANWGAFIYVAAVSFFLSPVIVNSLGSTGYGVWSLLVAVVGYLGLLDFGVRGAVTRFIAHHHAVGDLKASSLIATAAVVLFGLLGLLAILISSGLSWLAPVLFHIPADLMFDARVVLVLGGLTICTTLIGAVYGGVVTGLERFDISSGIEILLTTVRSATVLVALKLGYGLITLAWIHFFSSVLYGLAMWGTVRRILPGLRFQFREKLAPHVRTILSFSTYLSMIHILGIVIYYTDALVIATLLPISAVGIYAIAGNLADYARKVASALSKMFTPRISAMKSAGSDQIVSAVLEGSRAATLATLPIVMTYLFRGETFIRIWMGPEYGHSAGAVLEVFAYVVWAGSARAVAGAAIIGVNLHRRLIPLLVFEAVCNLVLSIVLARRLGVVGVAVGTLIPGLIVSLVLMPRCLKQTIGVPVSAYYSKALLRPTLSCVPFAIATYLIERYLPTDSMGIFFLQVCLAAPLAIAGAFAGCLTAEERGRAVGVFRALFAPG